MRRSFTLLLGIFVVSLFLEGCSWKKRTKFLTDAEFSHYYALRPFMDEDVRKEFLKLKTEKERTAYLKNNHPKGFERSNYWDLFYKYDEAQRDAIVAGEVEVGWEREMVYMAWGKPYDRKKLVGRPAPRSELLEYRFEVLEDGSIMLWSKGSKNTYHAVRRFTKLVIVDDTRVSEIEEKAGW